MFGKKNTTFQEISRRQLNLFHTQINSGSFILEKFILEKIH